MKKNWTVKRIEDICEKASSNIAQNKLDGITGDYPVFGASGYVQNVNFYHRTSEYIGIVKDGSGVGRVNLYPAYSSLLGTMQYILPKEGNDIRFIAYALKSLDLASFASGAAIPHIYFKDYGKCELPVPPRDVQERIVAELDLLNGVLEKQKAQLKELDALAQSIFYDMFGDPIENPKGWEKKTLETVSLEILAGGDKPSDCLDFYTDEYRYPVIANGAGDKGILGYSKNYKVDRDAVALSARGASIGNCRICKAKFTPVVRLITVIPKEQIDIEYLYYCVQQTNFNINGAGQAQLTIPNVKSQKIQVPPLPLQQVFADKIASIEKQKAAINQSIAETQKLLDYTMDKYFG